MKKIVLAASLLVISATAHAGTYSVEGVTVHIQDGCMSSRCVAVTAPGYVYYDGATNRGGHNAKVRYAKVRKVHKDTSRVASTAKSDAATAAPPAPAVEAAPAQQAEPAPPAPPSDTAPAK